MLPCDDASMMQSIAPGRLTVLQVLPALNAGGVENCTLDMGRALVAAGWRSLVMSGGGRLVQTLEAEGSEHLSLDVGRKSLLTLRHIPTVRRLLGSGTIDVVHVRSRLPAWIVWLAWRGLPAYRRSRLVTTIHGPYTVNGYSAVMTRGERVIAISKMIDEYVRRNYPLDTDRLRLIPEGIDAAGFPFGYRPSAEWTRSWLAEYPALVGVRVLAFPARITRWKGQEDFLRVLAALIAAGEPVHGLLIGVTQKGREDFARELHEQIASMGLQRHVTFTGHRSDLRDVMAASDIVFSLARDPEAFGRVPVEALSLGRPVIGYDHGGVGESLRATYPVGLVPVGDIDAVVARTREFLRAAPPVPPDQPFTLQRMTDATLAVYRELVESPRQT